MPETDTFGDDGAWNRFVFRIHVAGKVTEGVQCRLVACLIAQEGEERIDIFRLVVGPDCSIISLTTGTVHQSALGAIDALGTTQFGKGEHTVQHGVGGIEHEVLPPLADKGFACGTLVPDVDTGKGNIIQRRRNVRQFSTGKEGEEFKCLTRL